MCSSMRKPGLKLPSSTMGALALSTVLPASPPLMASKTSAGVDPGLGRQHQGLGHGRDVQRDDDLVGELGHVAAADLAAEHGRGTPS